jgi:hypothetical protein
MACNLTKGFTFDCKEGVGGIKEIFLSPTSNFATGVTIDSVTGEVTGLPTVTLYRYQIDTKLGTSSFVEAVESANGGVLFTQTVTTVLQGLSADKRKELDRIARNRAITVFVRDSNDNILMAGRLDGLELSSGDWTTGAAKGDFNGYNLVFTGQERNAAEHLETYTEVPFDNFNDVTVDPPYVVAS